MNLWDTLPFELRNLVLKHRDSITIQRIWRGRHTCWKHAYTIASYYRRGIYPSEYTHNRLILNRFEFGLIRNDMLLATKMEYFLRHINWTRRRSWHLSKQYFPYQDFRDPNFWSDFITTLWEHVFGMGIQWNNLEGEYRFKRIQKITYILNQRLEKLSDKECIKAERDIAQYLLMKEMEGANMRHELDMFSDSPYLRAHGTS